MSQGYLFSTCWKVAWLPVMGSCRRMTGCWPSMGTTIAMAVQRVQPSWYRFVIPTLTTGFELCKNQAVFFHHPLQSRGQTLGLCIWKREGVEAGWEFTPLKAPLFYCWDKCEHGHGLSQRCLLPSGFGTYRAMQTSVHFERHQRVMPAAKRHASLHAGNSSSSRILTPWLRSHSALCFSPGANQSSLRQWMAWFRMNITLPDSMISHGYALQLKVVHTL